MSSSPANDDRLSDEELVSAYLDGALDDAERARAERLLNESATSRALLEELRALQAALKDLPKLSLEPGFAERALQKVHAESHHGGSLMEILVEPARPIEAEESGRGWRRWARPAAYTGFVVAASLLIMLFVPHDVAEKERSEIAMRDNAAVLDDLKKQDGDAVSETEAASAFAKTGEESGEVLSDERAAKDGYAAKAAAPVLGKSGAGGAAAAMKPLSLSEGKQSSVNEANRQFYFDTRDNAQPADQPFIIHAVVTPEAIKNRAFENLLVGNSIQLEREPKPTVSARGVPEPREANRDESAPGKKADSIVQEERKDAEAETTPRFSADLDFEEGADVVEVVATYAQIDEVIEQMRTQSTLFQDVKLEVPSTTSGVAASPAQTSEQFKEAGGRQEQPGELDAVETQNRMQLQEQGQSRARRMRGADFSQLQNQRRAFNNENEPAAAEQNSGPADKLSAAAEQQTAARAQNAPQINYRQAIFVLRTAPGDGVAEPRAAPVPAEAPAKAANP